MKKPKNDFLANYWPMLVGIAVALVLAFTFAVPHQSTNRQGELPQDDQTSATSNSPSSDQYNEADTSRKSADSARRSNATAEDDTTTSSDAYNACTQATEDLQVAVKDMNKSLENRALVGNTIHVVDLSKDVWHEFVDASAPYLISTDYNCVASDSATTLHKTEQTVRKVITKVKSHQKTFEQSMEKVRNYVADNPSSDSASRETLEYRIAWAKEMSKSFKGHMAHEYPLTVLERVIVSTRSDLDDANLDNQTIQGDAQAMLQAIDSVQGQVNAQRISDEHWHYGF